MSLLIFWLCQWECEPEDGAFAWRTLDADRTAETLDNHATDVQSQTQAHAGAALDLYLRDTIKPLPDALLLGLAQARAFVAHGDTRQFSALVKTHIDRFIRLRIFERVGEIVADYLTHAVLIRHDQRLPADTAGQCDSTGGCQVLLIFDTLAR